MASHRAGFGLRGVLMGLFWGKAWPRDAGRVRWALGGWWSAWSPQNERVLHERPLGTGAVWPPNIFWASAGQRLALLWPWQEALVTSPWQGTL